MSDSKPSVAYLGPKSSYTHQAALHYFDKELFTLEPQATIRDVFQAVESCSATQGIVPFENSTNGAVVYTLDLLADRQKAFSKTTICGEAYLSVHHCLLGHSEPKSRLAPSDQAKTGLSNVKHIYSHPQAFGQCELFLTKHLHGVERHETSSTSKAAEMAAQDSTGSSVAIASRVAASIHNLQILAENIEDRDDNTTRFLILETSNPHSGTGIEAAGYDEISVTKYKTLVSFTIDHKTPGALAEALLVFKTYGLNLTSINSRPSLLQPWHYIFFVEFQGSRTVDPDGAVDAAMRSLSKVAESWRWLGSWKDQTTVQVPSSITPIP